MDNTAIVTGQLPAFVANGVSDVIHAALARGMETDEAVCVALTVLADYARGAYGDRYLPHLAYLVLQRAGEPMPDAEPQP